MRKSKLAPSRMPTKLPERVVRELRVRAPQLAREASAELARLRRIRGAGWRTARRIAGARRRLALAAALLGVPASGAAGALTPTFESPPFLISDIGDNASPAFADIDGDGDLDVFVGNKLGNTIFFSNTGTASVPAFAAPSTNPFNLTNVGTFASPTFADIDGDGDLDAFIGNYTGNTIFFRNTGTTSVPAFAAASTNPFGLTDVGFNATPAFADTDGDGDLDAFIGEYTGNTIFFRNTGTTSVAAFAAGIPVPLGLRDVGLSASPTFADLDADGDLDASIGNKAGDTQFFVNTGTTSVPAFGSPATTPFGLANVGIYASPAFGDLDGDGDFDALIGGEAGNTLFFENTGTASVPAFLASPNPFNLADVGDAASPSFADLDGDGDLDAFIGNKLGITIFFRNTGSASDPAITVPETNPFGLADVGDTASPSFADIDGDGDLDAFIGNKLGNTIFFANTGSASTPLFAAASTNPFGLTDVGDYASPTFADLDGDGDLDAFTGNKVGNTIFFLNTGSASVPAFAAALANPFGLTAVGKYTSPAFTDLDGDGDLDAFVGNDGGNTIFFENTGTASVPAFASPASTNPFGLVNVGTFASPTFADIDGDGDFDAFIGAKLGDTFFFERVACPPVPAPACTDGFGSGSLLVDERKAGKAKLDARLSQGPTLIQADFGGANGTAAALCIYDDADTLAGALAVAADGQCGKAPCWKPIGKPAPNGTGFAYKDKTGSSDGVRAIALRGGSAGKSSLAVQASNDAKKGQTALPTGIAEALVGATEVTLQVQTDAGCFETPLSDIQQQQSNLFQAK